MVWQNIKWLELNEKISQLEKTQLKHHNKLQDKLLEYEKLRTSKKIEQFARAKMGMIDTSRKDFIQLGLQNKQRLVEKFIGGNRKLVHIE